MAGREELLPPENVVAALRLGGAGQAVHLGGRPAQKGQGSHVDGLKTQQRGTGGASEASSQCLRGGRQA